jgi:hypothetical protein
MMMELEPTGVDEREGGRRKAVRTNQYREVFENLVEDSCCIELEVASEGDLLLRRWFCSIDFILAAVFIVATNTLAFVGRDGISGGRMGVQEQGGGGWRDLRLEKGREGRGRQRAVAREPAEQGGAGGGRTADGVHGWARSLLADTLIEFDKPQMNSMTMLKIKFDICSSRLECSALLVSCFIFFGF